jgi:hypothetical protein
LSDDLKQLFVESHFASAKSPETAVKRVVLLALKSPQFLYPNLQQAETPDDFEIASRLALTLWDSVPDKKLAQAPRPGNSRPVIKSRPRRSAC